MTTTPEPVTAAIGRMELRGDHRPPSFHADLDTITAHIDQQAAELAALRAEVERLRTMLGEQCDQSVKNHKRATDAEARLDWIARQADEFSVGVIVDAPGDGDFIVHGMDCYGTGTTFAEAIDAAMQQEQSR